MGVSFWDEWNPPKPEEPEQDTGAMNSLIGECQECGELSDDIMFGFCLICSGA